MQSWASHFRFPSLSFSICPVGVPSLQLMWLLWAWKEVREARWVCPGVDPERPGCLPATRLALCPEGKGRSRVAGWTPHPPRVRAGGPPGIQMVLRMQCLGRALGHGAVCSQARLSPQESAYRGKGERGAPHFKAKSKGSQQGILAPHTSLALLPAKSSLLVVHAGDSLPAAETPRAPWLLSTGWLSSSRAVHIYGGPAGCQGAVLSSGGAPSLSWRARVQNGNT